VSEETPYTWRPLQRALCPATLLGHSATREAPNYTFYKTTNLST
jgi:hypothetical protein